MVRAGETDDTTLATAWDVTRKLGKRGVLVKDAPAFVVNRLLTRQSSVLMQALENGNTLEETDEAALRIGVPMPPSALLAMVGPRVANHVLRTLHDAFPDRFPLSPTLENFANGEMDIVVTGERRFRVIELMEAHSYLTAKVETVVEPDEPLQIDLRERVITQHMRLLELAGRTVRPYLYQNDDGVSYFIAHNSGLDWDQKQGVLEMLSENERIRFLTRHLEALIPQVEQVEDVRRRVQSNGHFKDFPSGEL